MHVQADTLKLLGSVLHLSVFAALALWNCSHFHPVKVFDKFYRRFPNAKGSRYRFLFLLNFRQTF